MFGLFKKKKNEKQKVELNNDNLNYLDNKNTESPCCILINTKDHTAKVLYNTYSMDYAGIDEEDIRSRYVINNKLLSFYKEDMEVHILARPTTINEPARDLSWGVTNIKLSEDDFRLVKRTIMRQP